MERSHASFIGIKCKVGLTESVNKCLKEHITYLDLIIQRCPSAVHVPNTVHLNSIMSYYVNGTVSISNKITTIMTKILRINLGILSAVC